MTISSKSASSTASARPARTEARRARFCLPLLFVLLGLVFAAWASRIPALRDLLHLSTGQLGLALLCAGIGGIASFPLAAWMTGRFGAPRSAACAGSVMLLALAAIAFSPRLAILMAVLGCMGAAASCFDVAINAIGATAEKKAGRSIMSMLHAWFCVGTLAGALSGSVIASLGIAPHIHLMLVSAAMVVPMWLACRRLGAAAAIDGAGGTDATVAIGASTQPRSRTSLRQTLADRFRLPPPRLLLLGLIGFCGAIAEGGIADWSGVFLQDRLGAGAGMAPLAYAAFSGAMLAARLVADRLKDRFGAQAVVATGGMLAAAGIGAAASGASVAISIAGFALAGAGLAGVFPFVFSAAGRAGPTALAGVATISYCGGLVGPPVIGFIGEFASLPIAIGSIGVVCAAMAIVAARTRSLA
ncbi:MAG: MFS transporter [Herminiimonas sp.]|nr:MFS transporter [Herminiimonas sp.]